MKIAVCEVSPSLEVGSLEWRSICRLVSSEQPEIFVLNELPFGAWIASAQEFKKKMWMESCDKHDQGIASLSDLGSRTVVGSRPRELNGKRLNAAFAWSEGDGLRDVHTKQYFPNEEGYYEARWFEAGEHCFEIVTVSGCQVGVLLCTDVMFNEHARRYGREGAQVIIVPRAVGVESLDRWLVAMKMAAIVSGCFVLTSNRVGLGDRGQMFGGKGWVISPEGRLLAETSESQPVISYDLDLQLVDAAQADYPCYVSE